MGAVEVAVAGRRRGSPTRVAVAVVNSAEEGGTALRGMRCAELCAFDSAIVYFCGLMQLTTSSMLDTQVYFF